jgi:hypothetical protein
MVNVEESQEIQALGKELAEAMGIVARPLAPEDIAPGQHVVVLRHRYEYMRVCMFEAFVEPKLIRWEQLPPKDKAGQPLLVLAVSVPFVVVQEASGKPRTLDIRQTPLAQVSDAYAKALMKARKAHRRGKTKRARNAAKAATQAE